MEHKMSEKNAGRPLPPPRGNKLYKYEEIQNCRANVSIFQLFDLMERYYLRKASGTDAEAKIFQTAIKHRIKQMSNNQDKLPEDEKQDGKTKEEQDIEEEEDPLLQKLAQIAEYYRKRQTDRKDVIHNIRNEFNDELRQRFIDYEYIQISQELENSKSQQAENNDIENRDTEYNITTSSISSIDEAEESAIMESTPRQLLTLRTSTCTAKKKMSAIESKYTKLEKDIKNRRKILEELDQQLKEKQNELDTKEQEFLLKKEQIEAYIRELKEAEATKETTNTYAQTEEEQEVYSLVTSESEAESDEPDPNNQDGNTSSTQGLKLLEKEFIRHGRKIWSDKDAANFLRTYRKNHKITQKQAQKNHPQLDTQKITMEITTTIKTIYEIAQDIEESLTNFQGKITAELETIRGSKGKYTIFQVHQDQYKIDTHSKLKRLKQYCEQQIDNLQQLNETQQENHIDLLRREMTEEMEKQFRNQIQKLEDMIKTITPQNKEQHLEQKKTKEIPKKLIIIPNQDMNITQFTKLIRNEAKKQDKPLEINNIRKTSNNNIELKTMEKEIESISKLLNNETEKFTVIDPDKRTMKILLLRVNKEITKEDIEEELTTRKYLNSFNIIKQIEIQSTPYNNWIIEAAAGECRQLVKQGKIKIFHELIRTVFYIRVKRCTHCQELNNHLKSQCEFRVRCANCSENHQTSDCKNKVTKCINCLRQKRKDYHHPAYSPECPIYQKEKEKRLNEYYKTTQTEFQTTKQRNILKGAIKQKDSSMEEKNRREKEIRRHEQASYMNNRKSISKDRNYTEGNEDYYTNNSRRRTENRKENKEQRENTIIHKESQIKDRNGEIRRIYMRTFENTNRRSHNYKYPNHYREASPPTSR